MLRNAWSHVEAVQTTDLPMLIQHVGDVLHDACSPDGAERMRALGSDPDDLKDRQEVLVLYYLRCLCVRCDDIRELRFMILIKDERIVERLVAYLDEHHGLLHVDTSCSRGSWRSRTAGPFWKTREPARGPWPSSSRCRSPPSPSAWA